MHPSLAVPAVLSLLAAPAVAAPCDDLPTPRIAFERPMAEVVYDESRSLDALRDLAGSEPGRRGMHLGLTESRFAQRVEIDVTYYELDGGVCGRPATVSVTFGLTDLKVYVAREAAEDACVRREVLDHEERHVAVSRAWLVEAAAALETELRREVGGMDVVRADSAEELMAEIEAAVGDIVTEHTEAFEAEMARRQARIDTPEEYQRVAEACDTSLRRILERAG